MEIKTLSDKRMVIYGGNPSDPLEDEVQQQKEDMNYELIVEMYFD